MAYKNIEDARAYAKNYMKTYSQLEREKERKRAYMRTYVQTEEQRVRGVERMRERGKRVRHDQRSAYYHSDSGRLAVHRTLWRRAMSNARHAGVPFNLDIEDLTIPSECPILHIPIIVKPGPKNDNTPSMDRIIPKRGYVKGNVQIISWRANCIKRDATFDDLIALGDWARTERLKEAMRE